MLTPLVFMKMHMKISAKVKEKIARTIAEHFTTNEIVNVFTDANIPTDVTLYAKWRITLDAFGKAPDEEILLRVLEEFCHPLNFQESFARENFIKALNNVLGYEDLEIQPTPKTAKIVSIKEVSVPEKIEEKTTKKEVTPVLPTINNSSYSEKVIELVAREFGSHLSQYEIRKVITPILQKDVVLRNQTAIEGYLEDLFDEYPFYTFEDTLQDIRKKDKNADETISKIISALLHPLNHNADDKKTDEIADKIEKYLKYDNFSIDRLEDEYFVYPSGQFELPEEVAFDGEQSDILHDLEVAHTKKELIEKLREYHQAYMSILELFCKDITRPTKELNNSYLFLRDKIDDIVRDLSLRHYLINPCQQFKGDLYSAEIEWNGDPKKQMIVLGPVLSWDAIRPSLYSTHSIITKLCSFGDEESEVIDIDEKQFEKITNLISQHRTSKIEPQKDGVLKLEILNKYEKTSEKPKIKLSDYEVSFDDETAQLHIDDFEVVSFPSHKNEHYVMRKLFSQRKNEAVDWQEVYEAMTSSKSETTDKEEVKKQQKSVKDAVSAINTRVKEVCNTESDLLLWETKCIKRLY